MMNILAIETSSQLCSVAIRKGERVYAKDKLLNNQHSKFILSYVDELLSRSTMQLQDLDLIAVGVGPGSFTGVRLGIGVAQGLAFGLDIPIHPVNTLQIIAQTQLNDNCLVAVDARIGEIYWQLFHRDDSIMTPASKIKLQAPDQVELDDGITPLIGLGSGWDLYHEILEKNLTNKITHIKSSSPKAQILAHLAEIQYDKNKAIKAELVTPEYVRNQVTR